MKLITKVTFLGILLCILFSSNKLLSQQNYLHFSEGDPMPEWIIQDIPTYKQMKQVFLQHYGTDPASWPEFIREAVRLDKMFKEYNAAKGSSEHCYYNSFLFETDTEITQTTKSATSYRRRHETRLRNYYAIFAYCYPEVNNEELINNRHPNIWQRILAGIDNSSSINEYSFSYSDASKSEGMLPVVLYQFASHCPTGMLPWCFQEVFPALDHMFNQTELESKFRIIESVSQHIEKLYKNRDYAKAQIWHSSFYNFMKYYDYSYREGMPKYLSTYNFEKIISVLRQAEWDEKLPKFYEVFNKNLYQELSATSFNVPIKAGGAADGKLITTTGRLRFEKGTSGVKMVVSADDTKGCNLLRTFKNKISYPSLGGGVGYAIPLVNSRFKQRIDQIYYFSGYWEDKNSKIDKEREALYGFKEPAFKRQSTAMYGLEYPKPYPTQAYAPFFVYDYGQVYITFPKDFTSFMREKMRNAFFISMDEFLGNRIIIPKIYGMEYDIPVIYEQALEVSSAPREVKPDGNSKVTITANLYEYDPNEPDSSRPLAGKTLNFNIDPFEGVERGSLSAATAITDANGNAVITYTAPEAKILKELPVMGQTETTVKVKPQDYNIDELAYIHFIGEKARVLAYPSTGIGSNVCIIPPDRRFPALIEVHLEGEARREYANKEVTFSIAGDNPLGVLKNAQGPEASSINVKVDANGFSKAQYFFTSNEMPQKPVEEIIEISTKTSAKPFTAIVKIGLNLIFNSSENLYEGQDISAGELIPLKLTLKDAWYPDLDLFQILTYWGTGGDNGDTRLHAKLEIEKLGTVPDYLLDQLELERYPDKDFTELMSVKTFRNEDRSIKEFNILWMPEGTLHGYAGMPRVKPRIAGTHYYEAKILLTDFQGKDIFPRNHPASSAFFTINTGIEASTFKMFINTNPFGPNTKEAQVLRTALSVKYGTVVSIVDAFDAINRGDVDGLYRLLFNEAKGALFNKMGSTDGLGKDVVEIYSQLSIAEQIYHDILNDETGTLAQMDNLIFNELASVFNQQSNKLIILTGNGNQSLWVSKEEIKKEKKGIRIGKNIKFKIGGIDKKTKEKFNKLKKALSKSEKCIEVKQGRLFHDENTNCYSYKLDGLCVYVIPENTSYIAKDYNDIKTY